MTMIPSEPELGSVLKNSAKELLSTILPGTDAAVAGTDGAGAAQAGLGSVKHQDAAWTAGPNTTAHAAASSPRSPLLRRDRCRGRRTGPRRTPTGRADRPAAVAARGLALAALPHRWTDRAAVTAARRLNRAAGLIATSVLIDSAMEHYRGAFSNKAMYTPIVVSALSLLASFHGHRDRRPVAHTAAGCASTRWPG